MSRYQDLTDALLAQGSIRNADWPSAPVVQMDYAPELPLKVRLFYYTSATAQQKADVEAFIGAWDWEPRRPRDLKDIVADLDALTVQQKGSIWTYISGGTPVRWKQSNRGDVWTCLRISENFVSLTAGEKTALRIQAVAIYVREEFPDFLINPSFDPTINVPGWEPA